MDLPKHGANPKYLYASMEEMMPDEVIDFSVNLNPWGPPQKIFEQWDSWQQTIIDYPDPHGETLTAKIAEKEQVQTEQLLLGNGAAELIQLLAIHFRDQKIGIFQPTFSEYERMTQAYGAEITYLSLTRLDESDYLDQVTQEQQAIFLCHPNNPTGEVYDQKVINQLLRKCEANDCYLIIDEAFYDFSPDFHSMVPQIENSKYLIVLHSVTKMYAIAGIRLGVLFGASELVRTVRSYQSYWSVNALALKIGELLVEENDFVRETQLKITEIREQVFQELTDLGFLFSQSQVNFFLLRDPERTNQKELLVFLLRKGIIPRHTENYPGLDGQWLRFSVRPMEDMTQLLEALTEWKRN